jgi:cell division protein FtsB
MAAATYGYAGERARAHRAAPVRAGARVRWDRLGRIALLGVLAAVLYLYLSAGLSLLSTWQEAHRTQAAVTSLRREYRRLAVQRSGLESPLWLEAQAHRLGMVYPGEHLYFLPGLPDR